ncbi:MAG: dihydrodipicolinate synthase family protein [Oscillospiraceae bacterium]|nr:dihydrodipicolinate synthase family protein [Oscillospiraceae bacterium]
MRLCLRKPGVMNTRMDALVCGAIVGLAFQVLEDLSYASGNVVTAIFRAITPFHFTFGVIMGVPMIVYNVTTRTGVGIEPPTYAEHAQHPRIAAHKEANGNMSKIVETAALLNGALDIYSGNDDQIVPILSMGGLGVISVLSNVAPRKTVEMCDRWFIGDVKGAAALQMEMLPLINALFCEVNPIPVKAGMAAMGWCENYLRLPLTPMSAEKWPRLEAAMKEQGLI